MGDGSRWESWERWGRWPYRLLGVVMVVAGLAVRHLPQLDSTARAVATIAGLPVLIAGGILVLGPAWHRARTRQNEEVRRNPTGTTVPLDERLATADHPRARWTLTLLLTLLLGLGSAWAAYRAHSTSDSAPVGLAIYLFVPVPFLAWLTWRTRSLLHRRP